MEPEVTVLLQEILTELRRTRNDAVPAREILTLEEAADYLRFSPDYLRDLMRRQQVPYYRMGKADSKGVKGSIRFRRSKLDAWINSGEIIDRESRKFS